MNTDIFRWLVITLLWLNLAWVGNVVFAVLSTVCAIASAVVLTVAVIDQVRWERARKQDRSWDLNR